MKSLVLFAMIAFSFGAVRAEFRGRVMDADGRPLVGATAYIYTAAVKTGSSPFCPSCYADCGKSSTTAADGTFWIGSLDPKLNFKVLFVAEGHRPALLGPLDPASGTRVEAKLAAMPAQLDPARTLSGRVTDPQGKPVVGAIVTPQGCKTAERRWWGALPGVDPMSITNARGEFLITADKPAIAFDLLVEARGLATRNLQLVPTGAKTNELKLGEGATVTGRIVKDGKPLPGVTVGLVQDDRRASGDAQGRGDGRFR